MSIAPAPETGSKRRIGDILLELGFASEQEIAAAALEQDETGQPLGQILVNQGVITRLELASALAEQWSEHASITPLPPGSTYAPRPVQPPPPTHDEDEYAARLQAAVADLSEKVQATKSGDDFQSRVTELAERIESTVARTQRIEATMATLAESLEGVTGGVEDAFGVLQSGMSGLALDLARLDTTVAELAEARGATVEQATDPALAARLDELQAAVQELAQRPVDEGARERVEALAARVEELAGRDALEALHQELRAVEQRLEERDPAAGLTAELESQRAVLNDLRVAVAELDGRPTGSPATDERLARVEARLAETLGAVAQAGDVQALATRVDAAASSHEALAQAVVEVRARLAELAAGMGAAVDDDARARLVELDSLVTRLTGNVDDLGERVSDLVAAPDPTAPLWERLIALEALAREPPEADPRVARLADELVTLRNEIAAQPTAADPEPALNELRTALARLQEDVAGLDDPDRILVPLHERLTALEALVREPPQADPRVARLADELVTLRNEIAALPTAADPEPALNELRTALARLQEDVTGLDDTDQALAPLRERLAALETRLDEPAAPDPKVAQVVEQLAALEQRLTEGIVARDDLQRALDGLASSPRVERLAHELDGLRATVEAIEAIAQGDTDTALDPRVDGITHALDDLRQELQAAVRAVPAGEARLQQELDALAARLEDVAGERAGDAALVERLDGMERRLHELPEPPQDMVTAEDLARALAGVREEQVGAGQAQDPRVDELARAVESLRAETERVSARPAVDPGLNQMLAGAVSRLESVEAHLGADAEARRLFEHALEDLRAQVAALTAMPAGADTSATDAAIARLAERLDGLEALEERIERLADTVAELPARAATNGESADEIDADLFQNEMERTRMSIERLTLHIAEHDRALSEMMRGRGVAQRLDELEARLVELATSRPAQAPSSPNTAGIVQRRELGEAAHDMNRLVRRIEAAEEASHADREKLLTRLERMATSIDWRLQRLESAGETAA